MARVVITKTEAKHKNEFYEYISPVAVDAAAGCEVLMNEKDRKFVFIIENADTTADKTVTFVAGNDPVMGIADLVYKVPKGKTVVVDIDSARYKNTSGTDKGKVIIKGTDANIKVAVIRTV